MPRDPQHERKIINDRIISVHPELGRRTPRAFFSHPPNARRQTAAKERGVIILKKADFRTFYRDAHAVECLSEREKMLIGLTVAMMRLCDP